MSVKSIRPRLNNAGLVLGTTPTKDLDASPSPAIWADWPKLAIDEGEWPGTDDFFDFNTMPKTVATTEGNFGLFSQFAGTTGTITAEPIVTAGTPFQSAWDFTATASGDGA